MKKRNSRFTGVLLVLLLVLVFGGAVRASAETLKVSSGADITAKFQEALNRARDGGSVTVTVPAGTYYLSATLRIYSNTTITANSKTTIIRRNIDGPMMRLGVGEDIKHGWSGYQNITIQGGVWDGDWDNNNVLRMGHASNVKIKNVTFKNATDSHLAEIAACKNVTFSNCTFSGLKCKCKNTTNHEALQLDIMHKNHFANYPKADETPCEKITVDRCKFSNVQRGLGSHSAIIGSYFKEIKFTNNTFEKIPGYAIIATNYMNSNISNNKITNCGAGIIFRTANPASKAFYKSAQGGKVSIQKYMNTQITGNTVKIKYQKYPAQAEGISLYGAEVKKATDKVPVAGDYTVRGVTVKNNKITLTCKGLGICLDGADENTIQNNSIICTISSAGNGQGTGDGIRLTKSDSNTLSSNVVTNKKWTGNGSQMNGISIIDGSDGNKLQSNKVTNASRHGITIQDSQKNTVKSNKITTTKTKDGNGIYAYKSKKTIIESNTVSNTKSHAIQVKDSADVIIRSNTVKKTTGSGSIGILVRDKSNKAQVTKNKITSAKSDGIRVTNSSKDVALKANTIKKSGNFGLLVMGKSAVTESDNKISESANKDKWCSNDSTINGKKTVK